MIFILNAEKMTEKEAAHKYLCEKLQMPEYYGGNLDALYDCLTEMDEDIIFVIENYCKETEETYLKRILEVMEAAGVRIQYF